MQKNVNQDILLLNNFLQTVAGIQSDKESNFGLSVQVGRISLESTSPAQSGTVPGTSWISNTDKQEAIVPRMIVILK